MDRTRSQKVWALALGVAAFGLLAGCGCDSKPYNSVNMVDELGYGPAGRAAVLRQAIDTNDQTYLYTPQGELLPIRLALATRAGIDDEIGALEYEPLALLLRRALATEYALLAQEADSLSDPVLSGDPPDPTRIFNRYEIDRGRKIVRTTAAIGSLGFLRPDSLTMEQGIGLSRRFGVDLNRTFVIYGIALNLSGERFAFYLPVAVEKFESTYDDLMEKQRRFTIVDFAGWYYKHQAFHSTKAEFQEHYWVLPAIVGPAPSYDKDDRYEIGDREEQQLKYLGERPLVPRGGRQVLHRAMFEFVSGKTKGMLRRDGQLLRTPDQVFNALVADGVAAAPDGQAPKLDELTAVVTVDRDEQGALPNLGQLKDALDLIAQQKVGRVFVKILHEPGPVDLDLAALRQRWLEQVAARKAATTTPPPGGP